MGGGVGREVWTRNRELLLKEYRASVQDDENVLEIETSDGYTIQVL